MLLSMACCSADARLLVVDWMVVLVWQLRHQRRMVAPNALVRWWHCWRHQGTKLHEVIHCLRGLQCK